MDDGTLDDTVLQLEAVLATLEAQLKSQALGLVANLLESALPPGRESVSGLLTERRPDASRATRERNVREVVNRLRELASRNTSR